MKHPGTVVITGASAGVGRATAIEFARHGWQVGLLARGQEGLAGAQGDVEAAGGSALAIPCDVSNADAVFAAMNRVVAKWGVVDMWVNCAMVTVFSRARDTQPAEYRRVTEVTYLGYVHGTLAALEHMRPRNAGTIVQVGSALAYRGIPLQSAYCAAKFAIRGFTDSLRCELLEERSRVRLCMVHLPAVNTPQFEWARAHIRKRPQPIPPIFQPEAIAAAIYSAAQEAPRECWVGGPTVKAIVGNMLAPGLLDRLLARTGVKSQLTQEPIDKQHRDNLFQAVPGDFGVHGRFDSRASAAPVQTVDPARLRQVIGLGMLALAAATVASAWRHADAARKGSWATWI